MKLLAEADLTMDHSLDIPIAIEAADENSKVLETLCHVRSEILLFSGKLMKLCYRCGRNNNEKDCPFCEAQCHNCGKNGHIASVCRYKSLIPPVKPTGYHIKRNKPYKSKLEVSALRH